MNLRPYQQSAIKAVEDEFNSGIRSTLLVMATGSGKTICFGQIAKNTLDKTGQPVLVLAGQNELLKQADDKLHSVFGLNTAWEQADNYARDKPHDVVIGSVPTFCKPKRLALYPRDYFGLVIYDEAHHSPSPTSKAILDYFSGAKVLGCTATPSRHDQIGLRNIYQTCAFQYTIQDGIRENFLCNISGKQIEVQDIHLEDLKIVAGEFSNSELSEMLLQEKVLQGMVLPTIEHAGERPTIVFTTDITHAERITDCFNRIKPRSAAFAHSKMPTIDRDTSIQSFRDGHRQFFVNVGIATEGFDHPPTACIALFRPTRSLGLLSQMIGRGTRIADGKTDCKILDFVGVNNTVRTMTVMDVLDGTILTDVEHKKAQELQAKGMTALEALETAKAEVAQEAAFKARYSAYSTAKDIDVLALIGMPNSEGKWGGDLATPRQREGLEKMGFVVSPGLQKYQAHLLYEAAKEWREQGKPTWKQRRFLGRKKVPHEVIESMSFQDAIVKVGGYLK